MTYVAVMTGSTGTEYRTPCRDLAEAEKLVANYEGLGYEGRVELEEER